jgi:thiamine biosynthesis protein ThiS
MAVSIIRVNGVLYAYPAGSTISDVVAQLEVMSRRVEVVHNGRAVPIDEFASILLSEGDTVEVKLGDRHPRVRDLRE